MLNRVTLALARAVARPASRSAFASSRSLGPASLISLSRTSSGPVRSATTTTKTGSASARKAATSATAAAARKASGMKAGAGRPKKKTKAKKKAAPKKRKVVRAKKPPRQSPLRIPTSRPSLRRHETACDPVACPRRIEMRYCDHNVRIETDMSQPPCSPAEANPVDLPERQSQRLQHLHL